MPAGVARTDHLAGIQVQYLVDVALARPDVSHLASESQRQISLNRHVPRVDVAAFRLRVEGPGADRGRYGNHAAADVGHLNRRDAVREPSRVLERIRRRHGQTDARRIVAEQVADEREWIWIVIDAVTGSNHRLVVGPVRDAQT